MLRMNRCVRLLAVYGLTLGACCTANAQPFTHADTLRGSNGPGRNWWDVKKYDLHVTFNLADSSIRGYNEVDFKVLKPGTVLQVDLQQPLQVDSAEIELETIKKYTRERSLPLPQKRSFRINNFSRDGNAFFLQVPTNMQGYRSAGKLTIYYHGKPRMAVNPPWDGGLIWRRDSLGHPWISIACQGLGASVWYPCKDLQSDEPDSAGLHITIPDTLQCVGNGRLRKKSNNNDGTITWSWAVVSPINNYDLIPYIGDYAHYHETYLGEAGALDLDYWPLQYNLQRAKEQFKDVPKMMKALEYWFGPYPFYKDGYKIVEAPHLGMEHQSAIAYGNGYLNGYKGSDRSASGWGLKWDFIIVHESGHEWFGNNITSNDIADMWVHEGFTCYSETLFTEFYYGKAAGSAYIIGQRKNIKNDRPIIGEYGVNNEGSGDMYDKAANMIHTIRQVINNDSLFRKILRGLNKTFYHQTVTGRQVQQYINRVSGINFDKVFQQYLQTTQVPVL